MSDQHLPTQIKVHTPQPIWVRPAPTYPDQSPHTPTHLCQTSTYLPRSKSTHPNPSVSDQHLPTQIKVHTPQPICVRPAPTYPDQSPHTPTHLYQTSTYLPRSKSTHPNPSVSDQHLRTQIKVHTPQPICIRPAPTYPDKVHTPRPICVRPAPTYPDQSPHNPTHLCQPSTYLPRSKSTESLPSLLVTVSRHRPVICVVTLTTVTSRVRLGGAPDSSNLSASDNTQVRRQEGRGRSRREVGDTMWQR